MGQHLSCTSIDRDGWQDAQEAFVSGLVLTLIVVFHLSERLANVSLCYPYISS